MRSWSPAQWSADRPSPCLPSDSSWAAWPTIPVRPKDRGENKPRMRSGARDTYRGRIRRSLVLRKRGRLSEASVAEAGAVVPPPSPPPPPPLLDVHARLRGSIISPSDAGTAPNGPQNGPLGLEPRGVERVGGHYSPAAQELSLDPSRGVITWRWGERSFARQGGDRDEGIVGLIALSETFVAAGNIFGRRENGRDRVGRDGAHAVPKTSGKVEGAVCPGKSSVGLIDRQESMMGGTQPQKMSELREVECMIEGMDNACGGISRTPREERGESNNTSEAVPNLGVMPLPTVGPPQSLPKSRQGTWAAGEASGSAARSPSSPLVPGRGGKRPNVTLARRLRSPPSFGASRGFPAFWRPRRFTRHEASPQASSLGNDHRADGSKWGDAATTSRHEDMVEAGFRRCAEMSLLRSLAVSRHLRRSNV